LRDQQAVAPLAACDVIFCRNVFIYFSPSAVRATVATFAECMPSPGFLFVGASESLLNVTDRFVLQQLDSALGYVKR
jgi:chemotaxis protein methyltransferase CheR